MVFRLLQKFELPKLVTILSSLCSAVNYLTAQT